MKRCICVLLVVTQLAACSTLSTVPYGEGAAGKGHARPIAVGDDLRITFREGGEKRIRVTSHSADEICAEDSCIRVTEIANIQRAEVKGGAGIGLAVLLGLLALVAVAVSVKPMGAMGYGAR